MNISLSTILGSVACAGALLAMSAPAARAALSVTATNDSIVVTSSSPSWKATFLKSRGGALWDLRVPASATASVIYHQGSPGALHNNIQHGAFNVYAFRVSDNRKFFANAPSTMSRFELVENTASQARIAIEGVSSGGGFTFAHTLTLVPSGIRLDGTLTFSEASWHFTMQNNFAAGNIDKRNIQLYDADTGPVAYTISSVCDCATVLPSGIDYPFHALIPNKKDASQVFKLHALQVPPELAAKRVWFTPNWGEHDTGNGAFGVDSVFFYEGPTLSERGKTKEPQHPPGSVLTYAWSFQVGASGETFPAISGPGTSTTNQPPEAKLDASVISGNVGDALAFDGSGSNDPDGSLVSYNWDFGDGAAANGTSASHAWVAPGTYAVELTVTDDQGAFSTDTVQVTISEPDTTPPVLALTGLAFAAGLDDPSISEVTVDGNAVPVSNSTFQVDVTVNVGGTAVSISATDAIGNAAARALIAVP